MTWTEVIRGCAERASSLLLGTIGTSATPHTQESIASTSAGLGGSMIFPR